jgi:hypothetical protein
MPYPIIFNISSSMKIEKKTKLASSNLLSSASSFGKLLIPRITELESIARSEISWNHFDLVTE